MHQQGKISTMEYRKAKLEDLDAVEMFYGLVIDGMQESPYSPGWTRGVYPSRKMLEDFILENALTIGIDDNEIISAFALNDRFPEEWNLGHWTTYPESAIHALHSLAVKPSTQRKGLGFGAVLEAIETAKREGKKTIRLDVAAHNTIARKLYEKAGFTYLETITIEYAVGGRSHYALYEYNL